MTYHVMLKQILLLALLCLGFEQLAFASDHEKFNRLLTEGESYSKNGNIKEAIATLESAWQIALQQQAIAQQVAAATELGTAYERGAYFTEAEKWLKLAEDLVKQLGNSELALLVSLRQGNYYAAKGEIQIAKNHYTSVVQKAAKAKNKPLMITASINLAKYTKSKSVGVEYLQQAFTYLQQIPNSTQRAQLLLATGFQAKQLGQTQLAYLAFQEALSFSQVPRIRSQAYGHLAGLYENQNKISDAFFLNEQAIAADTSVDLMLLWEWQRARLLVAQNRKTKAIAAYRSTINYLQQIRVDIPINFMQGESSFRKIYAPIYLALIDLLLQEKKSSQGEKQKQLLEVQSLWESFKATELQDYFRDTCLVEQLPSKHWVNVKEKTAVIYPIILPDRLELIVRFNDIIKHYTVVVSREQLHAEIEQLIRELNRVTQTLTANQTIYQWLIKPVEAELENHKIDTLVYIPDAKLRKIPLGVLSDGHKFLIQRYAIATEPGLSIFKQSLDKVILSNVLLAGMSIPGPVVNELIDKKFFTALGGTSDRSISNANGVLSKQERNIRAGKLQNILTLPGVNNELDQLAVVMPSTILKNKAFTLNQFKDQVKKGKTAIHIASHGFFSGDPEKSFVMTYDRLLDMKKLTQMFQSEHFSEHPVEILTLSACQTAEGDDRAPLGLSGIVVQAGVKSAIGSLWPIADEVAQQLFTEFYRQYSHLSRAKALQSAQLDIMNNSKYSAPYYWSPFVLVGDWN